MEQAQIDLWVIEAKQGNKTAFSQLCRHFHPNLLRFAFKLCNNEQLAHDAVQNSWLKVTKSIHRIEDPRAFRSWMYQSVRWQTLDLLRKNQRVRDNEISDDIDSFSSINDDINSGVNSSINTKKTNNLNRKKSEDLCSSTLLEHIASLSEIDKQAIHLFYLEQMSLQEISIILDVAIGTIKSRLNRARNMLKQKLTAEC